MKKLFFFILSLIIGNNAFAQIGGRTVYALPDLPSSARVAALGGYHISTIDQDVNLASENPALLNPEMDQQLSLSVTEYISDSKYGQASYGRHFEGMGSFMASLKFLQYGQFTRADRYGNKLGEFSAGEYSLKFAGAKKLDRFFMGWALNFLYGSLESYSSLAASMDFGITYEDTSKLITTSLVAKNLGTQITPYRKGNREPIPLDIQMAFSKKFAHMPLRLTILAHHLNIPDLTYPVPDEQQQTDLETGQPVEQEVSLGEKIFRHFVISGELIFSEHFHVRLGYNHQRRQTMTIENNKGLVGFTFGAGIQISKFRIGYGYGAYHIADATNHITISTNLSEIFVKE